MTSIRARFAVLALPCLLALVLVNGQAPTRGSSTPLTVVTPGNRTPLAVFPAGDREMVALADVAAIFGLSVREDTVAGGITVSCRNATIALTPGQNLVSAAGRLVSLPAPVTRDGRRLLVPPEFISRAMAPACGTRVDLRPASRLVVVGDARVPRIAVSVDGTPAGARVSFDVSSRTAHALTQDGSRLLVRFETDAIDASVTGTGMPGLVQGVRVVDPANLMAIELGPRFGSYRASTEALEGGGERFNVEIVSAPSAQVPLAQIAPPLPPPPPQAVAPEAPPTLIVVDAGHGGDDGGTKGPGGTLEKDVTLAVARQLKAAIETRLGVRVLLTRETDQAVPPDDRTALANNNKASMFVSLHVNASLRPEVRGATVFYLDAGAEQQDVPPPRGAILPTLGGGSREIEIVPWEMAQTRFVADSAAMAAAIGEAIQSRTEQGASSVVQAPLRVLVGANMPAVLIELGYVSNADEEQQLASGAYQAQLVQALVEGLTRFRSIIGQPRQPAPAVAPPRGPERRAP